MDVVLVGQALFQALNIQRAALVQARLLLDEVDRRRPRAERLVWVRPWILRRPAYGMYANLMHELEAEDPAAYRNFVRIDSDFFNEILQRIEPRITRRRNNWRKALEPGLMLALTLR